MAFTPIICGATRAEPGAALDQLGRNIAAARAAAPVSPLLLTGISQAACVAFEYALRHGPWPGAMAALKRCRVGVRDDERPAADLAGLEVYLTGADADPWIPIAAFAEAAQALGEGQALLRAEFFSWRPHEVSDREIAALSGMIRTLARRGETQVAT